MSTVDDGQRPAALLHQGRRYEILVTDAAGHRTIQIRHDGAQVRAFVGNMPVRPEHDTGQPYRVETLATDVPDDDPDAVRCVECLVQVSTDIRGGCGGDVPRGYRKRTEL